MSDPTRQAERLKRALRENLKRRKAQARARVKMPADPAERPEEGVPGRTPPLPRKPEGA